MPFAEQIVRQHFAHLLAGLSHTRRVELYIKQIFLISLFFLSGCAMMQDYVASTDSNASKISIQRHLNASLLGSTTYIYEVNPARKCNGDNSKEDSRFMVLDKGNPLVSEFNPNGVSVTPDKPITLLLHSIAGPINQCTVIISFTPRAGADYKIDLWGQLDRKPNVCKADLAEVVKNSNIKKRTEFGLHEACNV